MLATIASVPGIRLGHWTNLDAATGCTVVLCEQAPRAGADVRPDATAGYAACQAATDVVEQGCVGAGTGATVAKLAGPSGAIKSGIGTAARQLPDGTIVGALLAV